MRNGEGVRRGEVGIKDENAERDELRPTNLVRNSDLLERTRQFALRIIQLASMMPRTIEGDIIAKQVVKSGTSVGANYREAGRARSKAEFTAKIGVVEQEADKTLYWLEIIRECDWIKHELVDSLVTEADELVAIFTTIGKIEKVVFVVQSIVEHRIGSEAETWLVMGSR
jgi:four helix bundle protein